MAYYVYENWTHDRARVHAGNCGFCNEGVGMHAEDSGANGRWLGPFPDCAAAVAAAHALHRADTGTCNNCNPKAALSNTVQDRADPSSIIAGKTKISDRVRALAQAGYSRSEIAKLIDRTYQQVRQVLVEDERRRSRQDQPAPISSGFHEETAPFDPFPKPTRPTAAERLEVDGAGRLTLSPKLRDVLGLAPGDVCVAIPEGEGVIMLMSPLTAMKQAQAIIRRFIPPGVSLVDELLAERRAEVERENQGD